MAVLAETRELSYRGRIETLREIKLAQTAEKQRVIGPMDRDDHRTDGHGHG